MGDGSQLTGITSVTTSSIQNLGIGIISGSELGTKKKVKRRKNKKPEYNLNL